MEGEMRGFVAGILSGDSLIVRFVGHQTQVVCLEYLIAPKFGSSTQVQDEPFGYDAWAFIRDKSIGKRVLVQEARPTKTTRFHPAFGSLPVIFTRITLADTQEDLGLLACSEGWVKIRDMKDFKISNSYMTELQKAQSEAEAAKRGIWSGKPGFVRRLPVRVDPDKLMRIREFDVNVEGIRTATSFSVNVLPTHENITLSITGCRPANSKSHESDKLYEESKESTRNKFLNRKIRVHLTQYVDGEYPYFSGYFVDQKMDLALADSIKKGFVLFNKKTQEQCPNTDLYLRSQYEAQLNKVGYWAKQDFQVQSQTGQFQGTITSIKGSDSFYISLEGNQKRIVKLNNVAVPRFSTVIGCEPYGFEVREFLRQNFHKKFVTVFVEGNTEDHLFGTIICNNISIQEALVEKGYAKIAEPVCKIQSAKIEQITRLQQQAKDQQIGIWAPTQPAPFVYEDYTVPNNPPPKHLQGQKYNCIIEHIITSTRYKILIPEIKAFVNVSLNGLVNISQQDKFGQESKMYCYDSLLQTEAEVEFVTIDDYKTIIGWVVMRQNGQNIAIQILERGLSEISPKALKTTEIEQSLKDAQNKAKSQLLGIWSDRTRHPIDLQPYQSYAVTVTSIFSPTQLVVQFNLGQMVQVETELMQPTEKLTENPLKNECCVYRFNNKPIRARVETVNNQTGNISVTLIDYAQTREVKLDDLYKLPPSLYGLPPQGRVVTLAGLQLIEESKEQLKENTDKVWNAINKNQLYMWLISDDGPEPTVLLLDKPTIEGSGSLNYFLVQNKMATYQEGNYPERFQFLFDQLKIPQQ